MILDGRYLILKCVYKYSMSYLYDGSVKITIIDWYVQYFETYSSLIISVSSNCNSFKPYERFVRLFGNVCINKE